MSDQREKMVLLAKEAQIGGASQQKACAVMSISPKTLQRWTQAKGLHDGRLMPVHTPPNKLSDLERQEILNVCNDQQYRHLPPSKIVPSLADKGIYIASESTFYRVLKTSNQLKHRLASKPVKSVNQPKALKASGPNQVYSWDITYLPSPVKGVFFYLYLVMDIYSRKMVGWQVYDNESSALAADLMKDICQREKVKPHQVVLHSDNGSPMKGATMLATLQELGVIPSFSRPSVSNDNPYSESLYRTLKYRPEYPEKAFRDLSAARDWVAGFEHWYNEEHLHSSIKFVTPSQRHQAQDSEILQSRKVVYELAKKKHPERWSGDARDWSPVGDVLLNPEKSKIDNDKHRAA